MNGLTDAAKRLDVGKDEDDDEEESGTGVLTSQLRHFVIQVSNPTHPNLEINVS